MKKSVALVAGLLAATVFAAPQAIAGPIVDAAAKAEKLADDGKARDAVFAMDAAVAKLWDQIGLTIVEATFTDGKPKSFGRYTLHPTNKYQPGEDMFVYAEAIGYRFSGGEGEFNISLSADLEIRTAAGKVLAKKPAFTKLAYNSRTPNREFMITITYEFDGLPKGNYEVTTTLNDDNFDQWASFDLPFEIE